MNNANGMPERPLAVVTGASSGIGLELAKVFARNHFDLLIAAENDWISEAADACREFGGQVDYLQVDLAESEGVEEFYTKIKSLSRPVDAIAINAGVGVGGEFIATDWKEELNLIQLNIVSLAHLTKYILKDMVEIGRGKILFTSSVAGEMPGPYYAVYAASKAFVQSFSEAIREEVKDKGITVTALQPGATDTQFFERAHMLDTKAGQAKKADPADVAKIGFDALMSNQDHVVAGLMNKVQTIAAKFMTDPQGAKAQGAQTKPNALSSKKKHA